MRLGHTGVVWIRTLCVGAITPLVTLRSDVRNRAGCRRRVALYPGDTALTSPMTRQRESAAGVAFEAFERFDRPRSQTRSLPS